jgi:hypothetical protein
VARCRVPPPGCAASRRWPMRRMRRALGARQKGGLVPAEELAQAGAVQTVAGREVGLGADSGVAVPGACQLAVVAAVDAVAQQWPQGPGSVRRARWSGS